MQHSAQRMLCAIRLIHGRLAQRIPLLATINGPPFAVYTPNPTALYLDDNHHPSPKNDEIDLALLFPWMRSQPHGMESNRIVVTIDCKKQSCEVTLSVTLRSLQDTCEIW